MGFFPILTVLLLSSRLLLASSDVVNVPKPGQFGTRSAEKKTAPASMLSADAIFPSQNHSMFSPSRRRMSAPVLRQGEGDIDLYGFSVSPCNGKGEEYCIPGRRCFEGSETLCTSDESDCFCLLNGFLSGCKSSSDCGNGDRCVKFGDTEGENICVECALEQIEAYEAVDDDTSRCIKKPKRPTRPLPPDSTGSTAQDCKGDTSRCTPPRTCINVDLQPCEENDSSCLCFDTDEALGLRPCVNSTECPQEDRCVVVSDWNRGLSSLECIGCLPVWNSFKSGSTQFLPIDDGEDNCFLSSTLPTGSPTPIPSGSSEILDPSEDPEPSVTDTETDLSTMEPVPASPSPFASPEISPSPSLSSPSPPSLSLSPSPSGPSQLATVVPSPSPTPPPCIGVDSLHMFERSELVFKEHRRAPVLCDRDGNCATEGHMVTYLGSGMMMKSYCLVVQGGCERRVKWVNSPKMSVGLRIKSSSEDLEFTAFAGRYGGRAEEIFLSAVLRLGL